MKNIFLALFMLSIHENSFLLQVADLMVFVASGSFMYESCELKSVLDSFGSQCLPVMRTLGLPSTAVLIRVSIM